MIEWVCDSCGERVEHEDPNPPKEWAAVKVIVSWPAENGNNEYESDQLTFCNKGCRTGSGGTLEARAMKILREGFDSRPRPSNK